MQTGKSKILELYPSVEQKHIESIKPALCPFAVPLPSSLKPLIEKVCAEFISYKKETKTTDWADSALNSLDFHYSNGQLKIIEANTNASGFLVSNILLSNKEEALEFEKLIFKSFKTVFKNDDFKNVSIVDDSPQTEKMYTEFLMFKDFFERNGIDVEILKTSNVTIKDDKLYIYNRDTDFYLENHLVLKALWQSGQVHLSTSPHSYQNIADKKYDTQQTELLMEERFQSLNAATLKTMELSDETRDVIWENRKKHFLKPSSSFGSKGVYSGKSISRKKFDSLEGAYLAQELHPPGKVSDGENDWKFDIRAFFSENGAQKIIARVYQGQLTNFSNLGGGFALIDWVD